MSTTPPEPRPVAELSYEEARDELVRLVARIEGGDTPLEESMRLWQRGEELAAHCTSWLDRAQAGLDGTPAPVPGAPDDGADEDDDLEQDDDDLEQEDDDVEHDDDEAGTDAPPRRER